MGAFNPEEMDREAEKAEVKLQERMGNMDIKEQQVAYAIFQWFSDYYLKAGHKRLGRILVRLNKERS